MEQDLDKDELYMRMALQQAHLAMDEDEIPIGCIIICNDKIIAKGYNQTEKLSKIIRTLMFTKLNLFSVFKLFFS